MFPRSAERGQAQAVTCQVVRAHVSWTSTWPRLFHVVEAHESQRHVGWAKLRSQPRIWGLGESNLLLVPEGEMRTPSHRSPHAMGRTW